MNTSKQINIMVLLVFAAALATGAYTLWDPHRAKESETTQLDKTVERGAFWFSQNCRQCHGDRGEGGATGNRLAQAPALNRPDLQAKDGEGNVDPVAKVTQYKRVYYTITCGRVGTPMPTWASTQGGTLSTEQIAQLTTMVTEGTGWDKAKDFAVHGSPKFDVHGDDAEHLTLTRALDGSSTQVYLQSPDVDLSKNALPVVKNDRIVVDDEIMLITDVNHDGDVKALDDQGNVTSTNHAADFFAVERGVGTTNPKAHDEGAQVLHSAFLSPPNPPAIVGAEGIPPCGQKPPPATAAAGATPAAGETPTAGAGQTSFEVAGQGNAFDKTLLTGVTGQKLTVHFVNQDGGTVHDIHFFNGADKNSGDVDGGTSDIILGPADTTITFGPLDPGSYFYHCDIHPDTMAGTLAVQ